METAQVSASSRQPTITASQTCAQLSPCSLLFVQIGTPRHNAIAHSSLASTDAGAPYTASSSQGNEYAGARVSQNNETKQGTRRS